MRTPTTVDSLEQLGRVRLSLNFFMRDFLYSEVANLYEVKNIPDDPDTAIEAGKHLCEELLEPLQATFGRISRSAFALDTGLKNLIAAVMREGITVEKITLLLIPGMYEALKERLGQWPAL